MNRRLVRSNLGISTGLIDQRARDPQSAVRCLDAMAALRRHRRDTDGQKEGVKLSDQERRDRLERL
jgi:hypothetical protein